MGTAAYKNHGPKKRVPAPSRIRTKLVESEGPISLTKLEETAYAIRYAITPTGKPCFEISVRKGEEDVICEETETGHSLSIATDPERKRARLGIRETDKNSISFEGAPAADHSHGLFRAAVIDGTEMLQKISDASHGSVFSHRVRGAEYRSEDGSFEIEAIVHSSRRYAVRVSFSGIARSNPTLSFDGTTIVIIQSGDSVTLHTTQSPDMTFLIDASEMSSAKTLEFYANFKEKSPS